VDVAISLVGPVLSCVATFLILFISYVYLTEIAPMLTQRLGNAKSQLTTLIGLWILGNLLFNFFRTSYLGPGSPPSRLDNETIALLRDDPDLREGESHRFCRTCNTVKPMRAHHCSICKKCVLKMDHHCPWVNTCVGWRNHKHFLLFLFYMWTGSGFFLLASMQNTFDAFMGNPSSGHHLLSAVICFSAFLATTIFLFWNIYLLLSNQSTIEFYGNVFDNPRRRNPFHLGIRRNIREVFGTDKIWTLFLPSLSAPAGDGIIFEMSDKDVLLRSLAV